MNWLIEVDDIHINRQALKVESKVASAQISIMEADKNFITG